MRGTALSVVCTPQIWPIPALTLSSQQSRAQRRTPTIAQPEGTAWDARRSTLGKSGPRAISANRRQVRNGLPKTSRVRHLTCSEVVSSQRLIAWQIA
ncbi:hypothetical protein BDR03DRAFT_267579 [Suillus americanus]|nr:hypothetical protein BDR03DRAFT_267579 [Suillus americanus]